MRADPDSHCPFDPQLKVRECWACWNEAAHPIEIIRERGSRWRARIVGGFWLCLAGMILVLWLVGKFS